jgi:predicted phage replisome organizer
MSSIQWIKIRTDIFDDEKIKIIDSLPERDAIFVIWIKLLTLAGRVNDQGQIYLTENIPYTPEMLSTLFNRQISVINLAISTFHKFGMVEINNDFIGISNWDKHQNIDGMDRIRELTRERVKKHREIKAINENNVTVTLRNATDKDKELEKDKEKEKVILWRNDFEIYKNSLREEVRKLINDKEYISTQQRFNPKVNIIETINKACINYWATEAGWKHKKKSRSKYLDWKSTITNAISSPLNKVWLDESKQVTVNISSKYPNAETYKREGYDR